MADDLRPEPLTQLSHSLPPFRVAASGHFDSFPPARLNGRCWFRRYVLGRGRRPALTCSKSTRVARADRAEPHARRADHEAAVVLHAMWSDGQPLTFLAASYPRGPPLSVVLTRSPGRFGTNEGATTMQS